MYLVFSPACTVFAMKNCFQKKTGLKTLFIQYAHDLIADWSENARALIRKYSLIC